MKKQPKGKVMYVVVEEFDEDNVFDYRGAVSYSRLEDALYYRKTLLEANPGARVPLLKATYTDITPRDK